MEKSTLIGFGILILLVIGGFVYLDSKETVTGNSVQSLPGSVQKVVISEKDLNYYPSEIKVKANQPVSISLDESVTGCLRSFTIKEIGISKYVKTPAVTIEFTPTKKGTFKFACSMGMGYGTIIVE